MSVPPHELSNHARSLSPPFGHTGIHSRGDHDRRCDHRSPRGHGSPRLQRIRRNVQNKTFANDLRQIRGAAEQYIMEHSAYPEDGTPGAFPPVLAEYLPSGFGAQRTPVGGQWDWDYKQFGCTAGISVYQPAADAAQMQELDALIDDGDISEGSFHARSDGYIYVIVP